MTSSVGVKWSVSAKATSLRTEFPELPRPEAGCPQAGVAGAAPATGRASRFLPLRYPRDEFSWQFTCLLLERCSLERDRSGSREKGLGTVVEVQEADVDC